MKIKGVIFDMDGVLFDSERASYAFMKQAFEECCNKWDDDFFISLIGVNQAVGAQIVLDYTGDEVLAQKAMFHYRTAMEKGIQINGIPFKTGAMEIIRFLKERNIPIALATSSPLKRAHELFEGNHEEFPFETVITGDMVTFSKPDPQIFLKAAKAMNLDIRECMVIEDSHNGMQAAIASGAISCMVPDLLPATPFIKKNATCIFENLLQVAEYLKNNI